MRRAQFSVTKAPIPNHEAMTFTKNIGMLLLAIYLILVGLIAVFGFNFGFIQGIIAASRRHLHHSRALTDSRDCLSRRDGRIHRWSSGRKSRDPVGGYL